MLDPYTFGKTPAARVLVDKLNAGQWDASLIRKIGRALTDLRVALKALEDANKQGAMSPHVVNVFANMLLERVKSRETLDFFRLRGAEMLMQISQLVEEQLKTVKPEPIGGGLSITELSSSALEAGLEISQLSEMCRKLETIENLLVNIMTGEVRSLLRRGSIARTALSKQQSVIARYEAGQPIDTLKVHGRVFAHVTKNVSEGQVHAREALMITKPVVAYISDKINANTLTMKANARAKRRGAQQRF